MSSAIRTALLTISCLMLPALGTAQSVVRVSVWPDGSALPLFGIYQPVIDPNGRFVVFVGQDIWLKDLETGTVDRIVTLRNLAYGASISADGRHLIFVASDGPLLAAAEQELEVLNPEDDGAMERLSALRGRSVIEHAEAAIGLLGDAEHAEEIAHQEVRGRAVVVVVEEK